MSKKEVLSLGRPGKYETHVLPRLNEVEDWCRNGATEEEMAARLGISRYSFIEYKKQFSDFSNILKKTKDFVDGQVENALLKAALEGNITAQIFWLKNRRPQKWREKVEDKPAGNNEAAVIVDDVPEKGEEYVKQETDIE